MARKDPGLTVQAESGEEVRVRSAEDADVSDDRPDWNPLGEETITVRVKPGIGFFHEGIRRQFGDPDFEMTKRQAENAAALVDVVTDKGTEAVTNVLRGSGGSGAVPRATLAGKTRMERIEALEAEQSSLESRLEAVKRQLDFESKQVQAGEQSTTGNPPRPGETPVPPPTRPGEPGIVPSPEPKPPAPGPTR
jgi:hypothetical protein